MKEIPNPQQSEEPPVERLDLDLELNELVGEASSRDLVKILIDSGTEIDDVLGVYLREMAQFPLLSAEEELFLGKKVVDSSQAAWIFKRRSEENQQEVVHDLSRGLNFEHSQVLAEADFRAILGFKRHEQPNLLEMSAGLSRLLLTQNKQPFEAQDTEEPTLQVVGDMLEGVLARQIMAERNTRLVISVAKKFQGITLPLPELIQEGNRGLLKAIGKYEYSRGFRFSTYATWWIRQSVSRAVWQVGRDRRLPTAVDEQLLQVNKAEKRLTHILGSEPSIEHVAEELNSTIGKITELMQARQRVVSLNQVVGNDATGDSELGEFLADKTIIPSETKAEHESLKSALTSVLEALPPREALVLSLRFGLHNKGVHTLEEIGNSLGVTRNRVLHIENRALLRIRQKGLSDRLKDFLASDFS